MTPEQRTVLAHVVVDPDAWWAHCQARPPTMGADAALAAKVARWKPDYEAALARGNYRTRAEREQETNAKDAAREAAGRAKAEAARAALRDRVAEHLAKGEHLAAADLLVNR